MRRYLTTAAVVTCALWAVHSGLAGDGDGAARTIRPVVLFSDPSVVLGESTLTRTDSGITMQLMVPDLPAGVYTAWMPIFHPGEMVPAIAGWVGGHVIGEGGNLTFSVHLNEGEIIEGHPVFPGGFLQDARHQDIGMVIRYHGPVDPERLYEQTHTFEPGVAIDALRTRHNGP